MRRLVLLAVIATLAHAVEPSRFYIISESFSDFGPAYYYRILDVQPQGNGSLIRYIRIAPGSVYCQRRIIQAVDTHVPDRAPAQLVGTNNPCDVKPARLQTVIRKYTRRAGTFETISFGIVATCSGKTVGLALPISDTLKFEEVKSREPALAHLWDLASEVEKSVFGPKDLFHDRNETDDLTFQRAGQQLVPDVISGQYDIGLALAARGKLTFESLLFGYDGPIPLSEADRKYGTLLDRSSYRFEQFVEPVYPPLAKMARIGGNVALQLTVNPATGAVEAVSATGGHALLKPSALDAAKKWRFEPGSVPSGQVAATIDFSLGCPSR
jgi:TonB family protein